MVTSIAGVDRFEITLEGQANHAGSTLMRDRKDALVTAAEFIAAVPQTVDAYGGDYSVATVGCVRVEPNLSLIHISQNHLPVWWQMTM